MPFSQLKSSVWIPALIRRAQSAGAFVAVINRGDPDAGTALIKVLQRPPGHATLYTPMREMSGQRFWVSRGPEPEADIDKKIFSRMNKDPDLWVVEIEDREGRHFLTDRVQYDTVD